MPRLFLTVALLPLAMAACAGSDAPRTQGPRAVAALTAAGTAFMYQDAPEFERFVQADAQEMAGLVKRIGKVE